MKSDDFTDSSLQFYDDLSEDYHFIFKNWDRSIQRQANVLGQLIKKYSKAKAPTILDCACGIGTQSIGLAQMGYTVHGTDISPKSIARAKQEAKKRELSISFAVADFRSLQDQVKGMFDVVIACDNALPHLLTEKDLLQAAQHILSKMKAGGLFIASIRDYDQLIKEKPISIQPTQTNTPDGKIISFQTWAWADDGTYQVNHFTLKGSHTTYQTFVRTTFYRAYQREEISRVFKEAGFQQIKWLMPMKSGYYQPLIIATT